MPCAVWSADDASSVSLVHPDAVVLLDANRRPTLVLDPSAVRPGMELPVHARSALITGHAPAARYALATAGVAVLDHWPAPSRPAKGDERDGLLTILEGVAAAGEPALIGVGDEEIGIRPLDGFHPAAALEGFEVPSTWWALGVYSTGRAWHFDHPTRKQEVCNAVIITRGNREVGWVDWGHGERTTLDGPSIGRVPDALRRALALPTPPPDAPTDTIFTAWWLTELAEAGEKSWTKAVRHHPAAKLFAGDGVVLAERHLLPAAAALGRVHGWDDLRQLVIDGRFTVPDLAPHTAAWMDAGMFSRELLARIDPIPRLLRAVRRSCSGTVARRAAAVVRSLPVCEGVDRPSDKEKPRRPQK